jgi:hypothetical protein
MKNKIAVAMLAACAILASQKAAAFEFLAGLSGEVPAKWGDPALGTPGGTVTYSFVPGGTSCSYLGFGGCRTDDLGQLFGADYRSVFAGVFAQWAAPANIDFVQVSDSGRPIGFFQTADTGQIRIAAFDFRSSGSPAGMAWPAPAGDVFFNSSPRSALDLGGWISVALHEIGHALGLDHEEDVPSIMDSYVRFPPALQLFADNLLGVEAIYGARVRTVPEPSAAVLGLFAVGVLVWLKRGTITVRRSKVAALYSVVP